MAVREQDVMNLRRQNEGLWIFGILGYERIDEDICACCGLDENGRVAEPGDARFL
jgi:hypothetical protein